MGKFDEIESAPRRTMTLFLIADTSGSMEGDRIQSLNAAMDEVVPYLKDISENNADAQIKVAVLEFSSDAQWQFPQPMEAETYQWRPLEAGGLTQMGEAFTKLNEALSVSKGFMKEAAGSYAPALLLLSDGEPTDNYKHALDKLKQNGWYKAGIKVAIAVGEDANRDVLAEFTGNKEAVLTVHNKEQLKKIIHFVSVTASQVASSHGSVGTDAPATKQEEFIDTLKDAQETTDTFDGVDLSADDNTNTGTDTWGQF